MIDTHAHLNHPELIQDLDEILDRSMNAGIEYIIVPAIDLVTSLDIIELVQKHEMLYAAIGIHPTELEGFHEKNLFDIENLAKSDKVVAIGEIGLDYYWKPYNKELQQHVLKSQIQIAKSNNLPVILHNRESSEDLIHIIESEYKKETFKGQFHSFSGNLDMAKKCIEMGFYISFTGNITYKPNAGTLEAYEIIKNISLTNLLMETDSPYLSPVPFRGKRNEPSYIIHTQEKIAELKEIDKDELEKVTCENAKILFLA